MNPLSIGGSGSHVIASDACAEVIKCNRYHNSTLHSQVGIDLLKLPLL